VCGARNRAGRAPARSRFRAPLANRRGVWLVWKTHLKRRRRRRDRGRRMGRSPLSRAWRAAVAAWFAVAVADPAGLRACPMLGPRGVAAAMPVAGAALDAGWAHAHDLCGHAQTRHGSADRGPPGPQKGRQGGSPASHCCCLGACCCAPAPLLRASARPVAGPAPTRPATPSIAPGSRPVTIRTEHRAPFPIGPPSSSQAPVV